MKCTKTKLDGVLILTPRTFCDERGWFVESYSARTLSEFGIDCTFVQQNHIRSLQRGVLRGIHFQNYPYAQAKLVRCLRGMVRDYAVDLRKGSPTYRQYMCVELSEENKKQLFLPRGFGHAVVSLTDNSEIEYQVDNFYMPEFDRTVFYLDSELGISWEMDKIVVSEKDRNAPMLAESDCNFCYRDILYANQKSS